MSAYKSFIISDTADMSIHSVPPEVNIAEVNMIQLKNNLDIIKSELSPKVKFLAVVKGDAYGHGLVPIALELQRLGCDYIGTVRLSEAVSLRKAGIKTPIMMLSHILPDQASWVTQYDITVMADDLSLVSILNNHAADQGKCAKIHVKVNTGLNRYGIEPNTVIEFIKHIKTHCSHIYIEGIYTHFKDAEFNPAFTTMQIDKFKAVLETLSARELRPKIAHAAGSGGIILYPESHFDMVRCGIILYGLEHSEKEKLLPQGIRPLMTLKSYILKIERIRAGESGGYSDSFVAQRDSRIAIIGIGYADGVSRGWQEVLIGGRKVPVVNYFMDGIIADITDLHAEVKEYDEVVIAGRQGKEEISWESACSSMNVNVDEQFQRITERVPKKYIYCD